MTTLIRNVCVVSPGVQRMSVSLYLENGIISHMEKTSSHDLKGQAAAEVIDGSDLIAVPGFIDIHAHGAAGWDVSDASAEGVEAIARKKLAEGVTTWLPTTMSLAQERLEKVMLAVAAYRSHPVATRCPGVHLEGPFLNPEYAGAHDPATMRPPCAIELGALQRLAPISLLSLAPELPGAIELVQAASSAGTICSAAHSAATYQEIQEAIRSGLRHITHFGNAMRGLHHREIGVLGAGLLDDRLRLEIIADGEHLCPDMLRLIFASVGMERLMLVTDSVAASWLGEIELSVGNQAAHSDGTCVRHTATGQLAGSTLRFNEGLRRTAHLTQRPLQEIIQTSSWNQAIALGLSGFGRIEPGYHADITLLRQDFSVARTIIAGRSRYAAEETEPAALASV